MLTETVDQRLKIILARAERLHNLVGSSSNDADVTRFLTADTELLEVQHMVAMIRNELKNQADELDRLSRYNDILDEVGYFLYEREADHDQCPNIGYLWHIYDNGGAISIPSQSEIDRLETEVRLLLSIKKGEEE